MPSKRKWIQKALGVKRRRSPKTGKMRLLPAHPGALHRQLGVPVGQVIPLEMLRVAAKQPGVLGQRARLALRLRAMPHKRRSRRGGK